jgi:hypothetical protein
MTLIVLIAIDSRPIIYVQKRWRPTLACEGYSYWKLNTFNLITMVCTLIRPFIGFVVFIGRYRFAEPNARLALTKDPQDETRDTAQDQLR